MLKYKATSIFPSCLYHLHTSLILRAKELFPENFKIKDMINCGGEGIRDKCRSIGQTAQVPEI